VAAWAALCQDHEVPDGGGLTAEDAKRFPAGVDTIVIGAGTAGAVVVGRLAAGSSERTRLLEAGPDSLLASR
jgi:hypothetical protein